MAPLTVLVILSADQASVKVLRSAQTCVVCCTADQAKGEVQRLALTCEALQGACCLSEKAYSPLSRLLEERVGASLASEHQTLCHQMLVLAVQACVVAAAARAWLARIVLAAGIEGSCCSNGLDHTILRSQ